MSQTISSPPRHRGAAHAQRIHRHRVEHHGDFRPQWSDLRLALWVSGLLILLFGIAGTYSDASNYYATPADATTPSIAVLLGGGLVVVAAVITVTTTLRQAARRRRERPTSS